MYAPSRRTPARLAVFVMSIALLVAAASTACDPVSRSWAWTLGNTHGAIIETTAGRASLGIYRAPSRGLYTAYQKGGVRAVQNILWHFGEPPTLRKTFTFKGHSLTIQFGTATSILKSTTKHLIYDDPNDLEGAVKDAHLHDSCLALTLISYGKPTSNWTQKQTDCQTGRIP